MGMRVGMRVGMRMRDVVVREDRVGVRPLWVTPCRVIGLLSEADKKSNPGSHIE